MTGCPMSDMSEVDAQPRVPRRRVCRGQSVARRVASVVAGIGLWGLPVFAAAQPFQIEVSHRARGLFPGEAVLVAVASATPTPLAEVSGTIFDRPVRFYKAADGAWRGLVGIDLQVEPGDHDLDLQITSAGGAMLERVYTLSVEDKAYPTRQLTVAPRYVEPPPEVRERIAREARQQSAIFATASGERLWRGSWGRPVPGQATSAFGSRSVFNGQARNPHSGADFRAAEGTPIVAPNGGRVVLTGDTYFSGGSVILDHGWGLYSYFAHLSKILVEEGELVALGQQVGLAGATGRVTGPHLHWTLRMNGARVDPLSLIALLEE
jgi:murein DD-endopeptidase MepM/ murein hydrolase activator NlpD